MEDMVFVFGTIRKGQPRHYLVKDAIFVDYATLEGFRLYYINNMFPGIVEGEGRVYGEVYKVNIDTLNKLDEAEDVVKVKNLDIGLSKRVKVKVKTSSGDEALVWCYVFNQDIENSTFIPSGDWVEFLKTISR
ncbi:MAG: gamma-glutamylcyclotransferase [Brevinematales bacterium]|nr:gamma-glutamylcyclotransferase [Brevinematales bacterium]